MQMEIEEAALKKETDKLSQERLADQEIHIRLTAAAKNHIIEGGYDPVYGARPLKRYLQKYVETLAAKMILGGKVGQDDTIVLDVTDGELTASVQSV